MDAPAEDPITILEEEREGQAGTILHPRRDTLAVHAARTLTADLVAGRRLCMSGSPLGSSPLADAPPEPAPP